MKTMYFILIFILLFSFLYSTIRNVPDTYATIQAGIDASNYGDLVLVQPGTYVENIDYNGKLITVGSLFYTTANPSYVTSTIVDGNLSGSVVTFMSGEDSTAVLYGFTITNGSSGNGGGVNCYNASSPSLQSLMIIGNTASDHGGGINCHISSNPKLEKITFSYNTAFIGGGIYCWSSSPSMNDIRITNNSAEYAGGGIYLYNYSNPNLESVTISNNTADNGAGIYCYLDCYPSLDYVTITDNIASEDDGDGGGIYCWSSIANLQNVEITGNSSSRGGGIFCEYDSDLILNNVTISNNYVHGLGAGMTCIGSNPSLENVTISNNTAGLAYTSGGGFSCWSSNPSLKNVLISGNQVNSGTAGFYCSDYSNPTFENVTISDNIAVSGTGGIYITQHSNPVFTNSIIYNNLPDEIITILTSSLIASYSDILGGYPGTGNIDSDPIFLDVANNDYRLHPFSPCIDTGNPASPLDPDGTVLEMGAYSYDHSFGLPIITEVTDVPDDQGHVVLVTLQSSVLDESTSPLPIIGYNFWQMYPFETDSDVKITNDINQALQREDTYFQREDTTWVLMEYFAAMQWEEYSVLSETLFDSTTFGDYLSYFFVSAHTSDPSLYFSSSVVSGYSVDNIAPEGTEVYIVKSGSNMNISWEEVEFGTFQGNSYPETNGIWYKIYAGDSPDFICDEAHLIDTVTSLIYDYPIGGEEKKFFKILVSDQP